uniref:Uncharacterized protein n=1 Tax=Rhizophora mucronata TaxID=61149 RepID=A0A2P2P9R9_RHIMU
MLPLKLIFVPLAILATRRLKKCIHFNISLFRTALQYYLCSYA